MGSPRAQRGVEDEAFRLLRKMLRDIDEDDEAGLSCDWLSPWEYEFLQDNRGKATLSEGQAAKILEVYEKYEKNYRKSEGAKRGHRH